MLRGCLCGSGSRAATVSFIAPSRVFDPSALEGCGTWLQVDPTAGAALSVSDAQARTCATSVRAETRKLTVMR